MRMRIIKAAQTRQVRWRNDGGWTREIAAGAASGSILAEGDAWDWRVSRADIERDGEFSTFPGIDRCLVLVEGAGMQLAFDDGDTLKVSPSQPRVSFAGERALMCSLRDGPVRAFNLMWRRAVLSAGVDVLSVNGQTTQPIAPHHVTWLLHVVTGTLVVDGQELEAADTVLVSPSRTQPSGQEAAQVVQVHGDATCVVATFERIPDHKAKTGC